MSGKTVWIVDGAYMLSASKPNNFDYLKLRKELEQMNGGSFYEGYFLNSTPNPPTDAQNNFHTWLKTAPPHGPQLRVQLYELKNMHIECKSCSAKFDRQVQKGVDVGIATLIIKLATQNRYDRLVLSAGDGDFEDAINYVKSELHKEIWVAGFPNSVSADLQSYADHVVWLDSIRDKIQKQ